MLMTHRGCGCCDDDPCSTTTIAREANGTSDGLVGFDTLTSHTGGELSALASAGTLAASMTLLSSNALITDGTNWRWQVTLVNIWSNPGKYRIIAQANEASGVLGDHIFAEIEILAATTAMQFHGDDWPIKFSIGQSVGGVETILAAGWWQEVSSANINDPAVISLARWVDATLAQQIISLRADVADQIHSTANREGLLIFGTAVTGTPSGTKVGLSCITQTGDASKIAYSTGTCTKVKETGDATTDDCPVPVVYYSHCPCKTALDVWASQSSNISWPSVIADIDGWSYDRIDIADFGYTRFRTGFTGSQDSLCAIRRIAPARYWAEPPGPRPFFYGNEWQGRVLDFFEVTFFEASRTGPYEVTLKTSGYISAGGYRCCTDDGTCISPGTFANILQPATIGCSPHIIWNLAFFTATTTMANATQVQTTLDIDDFDCTNFSIQCTLAAVANQADWLNSGTTFDNIVETWAQA